MRGAASACASVTVLNAMATGKGAAFGVELRIRAEVELVPPSQGIKGITVGMRESSQLVEICVRRVLEKLKIRKGARIRTYSDIPVAVGLSSSSAASNAAVLATYAALGIEPSDREVIQTGIGASFEAGVTLTGAFDDASASYYGCGVITDNYKRKILRRFSIPSEYKVLLLVPSKKFYTSQVDQSVFSNIREFACIAYKQALSGNILGAMTLNGLIYASALGHPTSPILKALKNGALAAGLTGKGPAVAAIAREEDVNRIKAAWRKEKGRIIVTKPSEEGARVES